MKDKIHEILLEAFSLGIDYGQYLSETERDSEDLFDAVGCMVHSRKFNTPSTITPRRQPHSEKWRKIKGGAIKRFIDLLARALS